MTQFRPLISSDQEKLWHWLHIALWDPPPAGFRPKSVLDEPHVRIYAEEWGREGDVGVVAIDEGLISVLVGCVFFLRTSDWRTSTTERLS